MVSATGSAIDRERAPARIEKAVEGAKAEAAKGLTVVAGRVLDLRKMGGGLASAALPAFGGSCGRRSG